MFVRQQAQAPASEPVWFNRRHFLEEVVPAALAEHEAERRRLRLSVQAFTAVMAYMARAADHDTGRHIYVSRATVADALEISVETVRKAWRLAETAGLLIRQAEGRHLTGPERIQACGIRVPNLWTIAIPKDQRPAQHTTGLPPRPRRPRSGHGNVSGGVFAASAMMATPARTRAAHSRSATTRPQNARSRALEHTRTRRQVGRDLADRLVRRVPWLAGTHPQRLAPRLAAYERRGWTASQLIDAMDAIHRRLGWASPTRDSLRHGPWALLGWYLDQIDPDNDHPGLLTRLAAQQRHAAQAAARADREARERARAQNQHSAAAAARASLRAATRLSKSWPGFEPLAT